MGGSWRPDEVLGAGELPAGLNEISKNWFIRSTMPLDYGSNAFSRMIGQPRAGGDHPRGDEPGERWHHRQQRWGARTPVRQCASGIFAGGNHRSR